MAPSATKKRKTGSAPSDKPGPTITDPRFSNIQSDPRYRLPGKKTKVKVDGRFARALKDDDFTRRAKVDRYGRPIAPDAEKNRLKRRYEFADDDGSDEPDDDEEVQRELKRVEGAHDFLREGKPGVETSSDESSDDDDDDDNDDSVLGDGRDAVDHGAGLGTKDHGDVPMGDVTSRIAVVNLDWDNIRAADLMAVFSSFLSGSSNLTSVAIYPSEFGKERMEREEMEGPPKEIFAALQSENAHSGSDSGEGESDVDIENQIIRPDDGSEFDSTALRKYQLERLRYFYAILSFSSPSAAKHVYDAIDGTEYLSTANFFDLRFVPDDTDFSSDVPREQCERIPDDYRPNDFVTDALQHSKVKLTWDMEDNSRKEAQARAFQGSRADVEENDLKAYLGSDTSDDDDDDDNEEEEANLTKDARLSKKEMERRKMRALLGLSADSTKATKDRDIPVGDMQVTFTPGLSSTGIKNSVFENSPEPDETTVERYVRKERERKQRRRERQKSGGDAAPVVNHRDIRLEGVEKDNEKKDLGFDDPFFTSASDAKAASTESNKMRKEERLKMKAERKAEKAADLKKRAELELLMVDDEGDQGMRHFDMREIERSEKEANKKSKKGRKNRSSDGDVNQEHGFKMDMSDARFSQLFENHEYAIDPTNPKYRGTKGMQTLLEEGRRRKQHKLVNDDRGNAAKAKEKRMKSQAEDVKTLVDKIKRQTRKG